MDLNDFNQSKYLSGREVPEAGIELTIGSFATVNLGNGERKPAVTWQEPMKPMLLNKTNRKRLEMIFLTSSTEGMIGRKIGVFFDRMVQGPNGDMCGGLRLRPALAPQPGAMPNPAPPWQNPPQLAGVAASPPPPYPPQAPAPPGVQTFQPGHMPNPARPQISPPGFIPQPPAPSVHDFDDDIPF